MFGNPVLIFTVFGRRAEPESDHINSCDQNLRFGGVMASPILIEIKASNQRQSLLLTTRMLDLSQIMSSELDRIWFRFSE